MQTPRTLETVDVRSADDLAGLKELLARQIAHLEAAHRRILNDLAVALTSRRKPGYVKVMSANGTDYFLFVEDDGTVKVHSAVPTQNSDGDAIGDQTD